jgi:geranylgeranyl diphosphate synthase type II
MEFKDKLNCYVNDINKKLNEYIKEQNVPQKNLYKAMEYSIAAGGKRLRPVLALTVTDMLGGNIEDIMPIACAIEMIHTYSLIHDDLPAMDNDDFRRGKPTSHKVFGEAMAILAGDGLLNYAFETMLTAALETKCDLKNYVKAMECVGYASGVKGMIGGQVVDLESEGKKIDSDTLKYMHSHKTGALIKAPVMAAAAICGATKAQEKALSEYSEYLGLAFQIQDDILDVIGDSAVLGKNVGSDESKDKSTFVSIYGLEKAKEMLLETTEKSKEAIKICFGEKAEFLVILSDYLLKRKS